MKVHPFVIPKKPDENLIFQIDQGTRFYNRLHEHSEIQVSYLISGKGKLILADGVHIYGPGEIFVFGSHMPHLFQSLESGTETSHMITLFFSPTSFGTDFFNLKELARTQLFFEKCKRGFALKDASGRYLEYFQEMEAADAFDRFTGLLKLIDTLGRDKTIPLGYKTYGKKTNRKEERLQEIFDFVTLNFKKPMTLDHVAEVACMTPNSFCRFFKQHTDKTFYEFLLELRIAHACELLLNRPDLPVSAVWEASGFSTQSNFNRKFKALLGIAPTRYRSEGRIRDRSFSLF